MNPSMYMSWTCAYITGNASQFGGDHRRLAEEAVKFALAMQTVTEQTFPAPQIEVKSQEVI